MAVSKLRILYIVILIAIIAVMIVTIVSDPSDRRLLIKCASLIILYIAAIIKLESRRNALAGKHYALQYKDLLKDAFTDNRSAEKQLMKGIVLYNEGKYDAAVSKFDSLKKACVRTADHVAVLTFRALCFSERRDYDEAVATYRELLDRAPDNSRAWSNMGLCYSKSGHTDLAADAFKNAIRADDKNAYAHTNYASLLLDMIWEDEEESASNSNEALKHARAALQINATLLPALSMACQASARLGDEKGAQEYLKQFGRAGGDWKTLKETMDMETAFTRELAMEDDMEEDDEDQ
ncbi:MAG: tetratricopeptide repeat protein [Lachnospiraceae bacterium]|nr:tetratricopeptide repeat protein [Lachnospiraceae bacterium]